MKAIESILTPVVQLNSVGDAGARAFAEALQRNGNLITLGLGVRLGLPHVRQWSVDAFGAGERLWR